MQIREIALTELDTVYEVVHALRPVDYDTFEDRVYAMRPQGYRMFGCFEGDGLITFAGVAVQVNLAWGRHLFVYDLVTRTEARSKGYGKEMLHYLKDYAKMLQCECIALTSGFAREDAHRFYEAQGYEKRGFTFFKAL